MNVRVTSCDGLEVAIKKFEVSLMEVGKERITTIEMTKNLKEADTTKKPISKMNSLDSAKEETEKTRSVSKEEAWKKFVANFANGPDFMKKLFKNHKINSMDLNSEEAAWKEFVFNYENNPQFEKWLHELKDTRKKDDSSSKELKNSSSEINAWRDNHDNREKIEHFQKDTEEKQLKHSSNELPVKVSAWRNFVASHRKSSEKMQHGNKKPETELSSEKKADIEKNPSIVKSSEAVKKVKNDKHDEISEQNTRLAQILHH